MTRGGLGWAGLRLKSGGVGWVGPRWNEVWWDRLRWGVGRGGLGWLTLFTTALNGNMCRLDSHSDYSRSFPKRSGWGRGWRAVCGAVRGAVVRSNDGVPRAVSVQQSYTRRGVSPGAKQENTRKEKKKTKRGSAWHTGMSWNHGISRANHRSVYIRTSIYPLAAKQRMEASTSTYCTCADGIDSMGGGGWGGCQR